VQTKSSAEVAAEIALLAHGGAPLVGIEALSRHIRNTIAVFPDHTTEVAGGIVEHNHCALVPW
jgi:hypothetical protein